MSRRVVLQAVLLGLALACTSASADEKFQQGLERRKQQRQAASRDSEQQQQAPAEQGVPPWPPGVRKPAQPQPPLVLPQWAHAESYWSKPDDGYTGFKRGSRYHKVYYNAWMHGLRLYAFLRPDDMGKAAAIEDGVSTNTAMLRLPVADMEAHKSNMRIGYLPGNTLLLDFPFQSYPDHLGHWLEIMAPLFSVLRESTWRSDVKRHDGSQPSRYIDRIITPNMGRHFSQWFQAVFDVAIAPGIRTGSKPFIIDWSELDTYDKLSWLVFENLVVIQDRYTHPQNRRGFIHTDYGDMWRYDSCERFVSHDYAVHFMRPGHGTEFRERLYVAEGLAPPQLWVQGEPPPLPKVMTLVMQAGDQWARIVNGKELRLMLQMAADTLGLQFRVTSLTTDASFGSHLELAAGSAVLIGRHGALMAASALMRPGAMVVELLPYKWEWAGMSQLYYNITQSMGDIHHFAWRPTEHKFATFEQAWERRYHTWTPEECHTRECQAPLLKTGLIVDIEALWKLLSTKVPAVLRGEPVSALQEPWPKAV